MNLLSHPHDGTRRARPWAGARVAGWFVAGLILAQLAGCAARFWPPSAWSLSVDLPYVRPTPAPDPAPAPSPAIAPPGPLKDPTSVGEALAYAEALCALPPNELAAEIERLETINTQDGHDPLRAQQLAFARQLASLYAERQRLRESNDRQALQLHERQRRIEQLNGQIEAMRAVEYSLPAAAGGSAPPASATRPAGAAVPRGTTSFAIPSAPTVSKSLPASTAEPAADRDAKVGEETRPPSEP
jgi:hypothetical protein